MSKQTKNYVEINTLSESSEKDPFTIERYEQFHHHFTNSIVEILDVGCNTGRGGERLKNLSSNLVISGLDCVQERLMRISPKVYSQTICSYSTDINIENSVFDAVIAGEFIEHLKPGDVNTTIQEFNRILKKKGMLLLTTPNPSYLRLKITGKSVLDGEAHLSQHHPLELKNKLEQSGFDNVDIFGSGKMSRYLGEKFPLLSFYGSYLIKAIKK